ncbi:MAG: hypothetical protein ACREBU_10130 [Nitrososphaera sp.]
MEKIRGWFMRQPVWVRWALAAVLAILILKAFGVVDLPITTPGLN